MFPIFWPYKLADLFIRSQDHLSDSKNILCSIDCPQFILLHLILDALDDRKLTS